MKNNQLIKMNKPEWGDHLRARWRERFASHLSMKEQNEISIDAFLWHLCSFGMVTCLEKAEAIDAFLQQSKDKYTVFYQFVDDAYLFENASSLSINDLPYQTNHMDYNDMYVMDWSEKWTFVMTHETDYGPYFIQIDETNE
ncbi:DUF4275 family protein [Bacillus pumilus]|uniref:DUF4275 family protein n=1 Tax=Bacillus pumilus TaxID=1408 RepID=UPI00119D2547|nr:DUF4275 family protein [Bacillus pumilus]